MPFTFSHPAIILPLQKVSGKTLSLTGLVVGSLTPDFEYFIRMDVRGDYGHTLLGLLWFDIPLGLILCFIYHNIVRQPLISNLPEIFNRKLSCFKYFDWNTYFRQNWVIVLGSIFIGAFSHIFWDAFTHDNAYFVNKIAFLRSNVIIAKTKIEVCDIMQYLSSLVGAFFIFLFILRFKNYPPDQADKKYRYWVLVFLITAIIFSIRNLTDANLHLYEDKVALMVIRFISAFLIGLIVAPWLSLLNLSKTAGASDSSGSEN